MTLSPMSWDPLPSEKKLTFTPMNNRVQEFYFCDGPLDEFSAFVIWSSELHRVVLTRQLSCDAKSVRSKLRVRYESPIEDWDEIYGFWDRVGQVCLKFFHSFKPMEPHIKAEVNRLHTKWSNIENSPTASVSSVSTMSPQQSQTKVKKRRTCCKVEPSESEYIDISNQAESNR
eukprot:Blabericola_migrator_1__2412@NODE_167_length_12152_cov_196_313198_g145_i0_p6_GENE_NODE_167_length_12152_cov_196_313198_g145_i0NODE_167_length_12152_cov_196_313198_g145_i0_p6_ORF_typecomplete_len173_score19_82_NODE_167_length_12152_cov_196_313198_g145_i025343052